MTIEVAEDLVYQAVLFAQNNGEFHVGEEVEVDYLDAYFILVSEKKLLKKEEEISRLKAQIEKMKNCDNCKFLINLGQNGKECRNFSCRHASLWELKK